MRESHGYARFLQSDNMINRCSFVERIVQQPANPVYRHACNICPRQTCKQYVNMSAFKNVSTYAVETSQCARDEWLWQTMIVSIRSPWENVYKTRLDLSNPTNNKWGVCVTSSLSREISNVLHSITCCMLKLLPVELSIATK